MQNFEYAYFSIVKNTLHFPSVTDIVRLLEEGSIPPNSQEFIHVYSRFIFALFLTLHLAHRTHENTFRQQKLITY